MPQSPGARLTYHRIRLGVKLATGKTRRTASCFNPTVAHPIKLGLRYTPTDFCDNACSYGLCLGVSKGTGLGQRQAVAQDNGRYIADGVNVLEVGLKGMLVYRHPAGFIGQRRFLDYSRWSVGLYGCQEVKRLLPAILENQSLSDRVNVVQR